MKPVNEIYCRKLGHYLGFSYCSREQGDQPCRQILQCWQPYGLQARHLGPYARVNPGGPAPPKLDQILKILNDTESSIKP